MNRKNNFAGEVDDPMVAQALRNFSASVDAWSEAVHSRPRAVLVAARHSWRLAATMATACLLVAGTLTAAVVERHHQQEVARQAAIKAAAQKATVEHVAAEQPANNNATTPNVKRVAAPRPAKAIASKKDDDLLADVDSDISRQVPAAMDPLAQLMNGNGTD